MRKKKKGEINATYNLAREVLLYAELLAGKNAFRALIAKDL